MLVGSLHFKLLEKVTNTYVKFRLVPKQDLLHAPSSIKYGDSSICWIKWRTDARHSPNLTLECQFEAIHYFVLITIKGLVFLTFLLIAKNTRNKLTPIKICFELLPLSNVVFPICGSSPTSFDKQFFHHFRQFSKCLSGFKHSYLSQMTIKIWARHW